MVRRLGYSGVAHAPVPYFVKTCESFLDAKLSLILVKLVHVIIEHAVFEAWYLHSLSHAGFAHACTIKRDAIRTDVTRAKYQLMLLRIQEILTLIGINDWLVNSTHEDTQILLAFSNCHSVWLICLPHARLLHNVRLLLHKLLLLCIGICLIRNSASETCHNHHVSVSLWLANLLLIRYLVWFVLEGNLRTVVHHHRLLLLWLIRRQFLWSLVLDLHGLLCHLTLHCGLLNRHGLLLYWLLHHHRLLSFYFVHGRLLLVKLLLWNRLNRQALLSLNSDRLEVLLGLGTCPLRALIYWQLICIWVVLLGRCLLVEHLSRGCHHLLLCHNRLLAFLHIQWLRVLPSLSRQHTLVSLCDSTWHYRCIILGLNQHYSFLGTFQTVFAARINRRALSEGIHCLLVFLQELMACPLTSPRLHEKRIDLKRPIGIIQSLDGFH